MTTSISCGSTDIMTAGRTFSVVRSVKGKGTRTMSPFRSTAFALRSDFLSILHGVNVLIGMVQKIVAATFLCCPSDKGRRQVVFQNEDFQSPMFRNIQFPQGLENPVFVDCLNCLWHRYCFNVSVAETRIECQISGDTMLICQVAGEPCGGRGQAPPLRRVEQWPGLLGALLCHCEGGPERSEGTSRSNLVRGMMNQATTRICG